MNSFVRRYRLRVGAGCKYPRYAELLARAADIHPDLPGKDAMNTYARTLFSIAAGFNFAMAASLLFLRDQLLPIIQLDAVTGTNLVFVYVAAALIASYGGAYVCVALDARKYRAYIALGVVGKLMVVAVVCWPWLAGNVSWRLPALASSDLLFAAFFVNYLRRTR